jgi:hypothetical protein
VELKLLEQVRSLLRETVRLGSRMILLRHRSRIHGAWRSAAGRRAWESSSLATREAALTSVSAAR